jgi:hypothetical protein
MKNREKGTKMSFRDQLDKLKACREALKWVGDKTIEQAWETCEDSQWMFWFLTQTDLDLIDPLCDIAEGVLHLIPEESQLSCIWAISAARRRANIDELDAAFSAAEHSAGIYARSNAVAYYAAYAAYATADYCSFAARADTYAYGAYATAHYAACTASEISIAKDNDASRAASDDASRSAADAASNAADAASDAASYAARASSNTNRSLWAVVSDNASYAAYRNEKKKQCNILRKYFTIDQIKEALNKLVS